MVRPIYKVNILELRKEKFYYEVLWLSQDKYKSKNPRLAHAKSKNDKNISGLLNQIIDNKEAVKIGIHTFTNASSFTVGESDVKIISIEFAPNEAVMAQFFGSVIVRVNADQVERSVVARGDAIRLLLSTLIKMEIE